MNETNEYSFVLAPSPIAGVGVFATHTIKKGTKLQLFSDEKTRFIKRNSKELEDEVVKNFCIWYCVESEEGYYCPSNFSHMEIGWYLNHSHTPNAAHTDYTYFAIKDIKKGEEIVIDYELLDGSDQTIRPINFD